MSKCVRIRIGIRWVPLHQQCTVVGNKQPGEGADPSRRYTKISTGVFIHPYTQYNTLFFHCLHAMVRGFYYLLLLLFDVVAEACNRNTTVSDVNLRIIRSGWTVEGFRSGPRILLLLFHCARACLTYTYTVLILLGLVVYADPACVCVRECVCVCENPRNPSDGQVVARGVGSAGRCTCPYASSASRSGRRGVDARNWTDWQLAQHCVRHKDGLGSTRTRSFIISVVFA